MENQDYSSLPLSGKHECLHIRYGKDNYIGSEIAGAL